MDSSRRPDAAQLAELRARHQLAGSAARPRPTEIASEDAPIGGPIPIQRSDRSFTFFPPVPFALGSGERGDRLLQGTLGFLACALPHAASRQHGLGGRSV